jgi:hypothetical protein
MVSHHRTNASNSIHDFLYFYASIHDPTLMLISEGYLSYDDELGSRMALNKVLGRGFASKA